MNRVLDSSRLEAVKQAAERQDWNAAGNLYIDLSLQMRGTRDRIRVEALAPYVRLRDAEGVAAIVKELRAADECRWILVADAKSPYRLTAPALGRNVG